MIGTILGWLTSGGIRSIGDQLNRAYETRLKADTDKGKLEAEQVIKQLEARRDVLVAEARGKLTHWIRPAFAFPFIIYDFKVIVWDKVLVLGVTDDLSPTFWQLQMIVFGAYFLTRPFERR